ncbi:MAG: glutamate--cysteine ligase [Woeseiaceae bacterium]
MKQRFEKRLAAIVAANSDALHSGLKGVEKESLRIASDGLLSSRPHPAELGSALTNRYITTDFSEALLEFVTPAYATTWETLQCMTDIHQFSYAQLGDEMLWSASMPCLIPNDDDIPLAQYGPSNVGRMKTIYRRGLGYRYGRQMQLISGVHFNYSLPAEFWPSYREVLGGEQDVEAFRSEQYLGLIRNFRRFGWLALYLFGASPALCRSFSGAAEAGLKPLNSDTYYLPHATSLRMSDLGYSNKNQAKIKISLNSLDEYVRDLSNAICTPEPDYEKIGVNVDGVYRQLNANLLQIENEYYSPIRPKRVARSGEQPTAALRRDGIEYVEIRSLDINPFDPAGINQNTMRFMEAFLIYCVLEDSPKLDREALAEIGRNHTDAAKFGRDPEFRLLRDGKSVSVASWAEEILTNVLAVAEVIDGHEDNDSYTQSVRRMQQLVENVAETPSARVLADLEQTQRSFFEYSLSQARSHCEYFAAITPLDDARMQHFESEVTESIARQRAIEASDEVTLDEYLQRYFRNC